jgi:hypothetical protein
MPLTPSLEDFAPDTFRFYRHALSVLQTERTPFLVGGAYALAYYTGIVRHTKDLDLFVRPSDVKQTLTILEAAGYRTEIVFTHWLAKTYLADDFIDVIFCSGNGLCPVDEDWFRHSVDGDVLGVSAHLIPAEEMIWQKAYIMERERFDGADVIHLIRALGRQLDWDRLLARFGPYGRILLSHLLLFGFVYPDDHESIPSRVLELLSSSLKEESSAPQDRRRCRGPLLSRTQYLPDVEQWGYPDPRQAPLGTMSEQQIVVWTDAGR